MEKTYTFNLRTDFHAYRLFKKACSTLILSESVYPGLSIITVTQAQNINCTGTRYYTTK